MQRTSHRPAATQNKSSLYVIKFFKLKLKLMDLKSTKYLNLQKKRPLIRLLVITFSPLI